MKKHRLNWHLHRRPDGPGGFWYYRANLFGRTVDVALGVTDDAKARELRDYYDELHEQEKRDRRLGRVSLPEHEQVLGKLGILRREKTSATLGEVFAAYRAYCAELRLSGRTMVEVEGALLRIMRLGGIEAAQPARQTARAPIAGECLADVVHERYGAAAALSTDLITEGLLGDYSAAIMRERKTPIEANRGLATVLSTATQARSLFGKSARASSHYRALKLPASIDGFVGRALQMPEHQPEQRISAVSAEKLRALRAEWKTHEPRLFLALVLLRDLAFRAGEAAAARWDWVREVPVLVDERDQENAAPAATCFEVSVVVTNEFAPKGRSRRWVMDAHESAAWRDALTLRASPGPLILGETPKERKHLLQRLRNELRAIGVAADAKEKVLHKLRKQHATVEIATRGLQSASDRLGHGPVPTRGKGITEQHYKLG